MAYDFFLVLFSGKKSWAGMKSEIQVSRKKQRLLLVFESFVRYRMNVGMGSIMRPIHICLEVAKLFSMRLVIEKRTHSDFDDWEL